MATVKRVFQLKVTLRGSKPQIWRRLEVPAEVTLPGLHKILQAAMGWWDYHLHQFIAGEVFYGSPEWDIGVEVHSEKTVRLMDLLKRPKDKMVYEYDFGDDWALNVVLEKVLEPQPGTKYPLCTGGKRAAPPEDCGGMGGFYDLLKILGDPRHPEHGAMKEWLGHGLDAEAFEVQEVNARLHPRRRRGRA